MASDIVGDKGMQVNLQGLRQLSKDINSMGDKAMRARLRQGLMQGAKFVVSDAKVRSAWSHRIPGSIRTGVTQRSVYVRAGGANAPHAVTFEGKVTGAARRHPVFARGDRGSWTWVPQEPRPFLLPALQANTDKVVDAVSGALNEAFYDMGWKRS